VRERDPVSAGPNEQPLFGAQTKKGWGRSAAHCVRSIQKLGSLGVRRRHPEHRHRREQPCLPQFVLHIFAAFAELDREMIRERVVSGIRHWEINAQSLDVPCGSCGGTTLWRDRHELARDSPALGVPKRPVMDACNTSNVGREDATQPHDAQSVGLFFI
jgi:Resolvase, N terminal domain